MMLITKEIRTKLLANSEKRRQSFYAGLDEPDHLPVCKLFNAFVAGTWLITEMDENNNDILYGIADLGLGFVEMGTISLKELEQIKVWGIKAVERDKFFKADKPISQYLKIGIENKRIIA